MFSLRRQGYRRSKDPPTSSPGHPFADDADRLKCGARAGWANATWPFITLTFDERWARVTGLPTYPDIWIDRDKVRAVRQVRFLWSAGLMFATDDGIYDGVIVWSGNETRRRLASRGWPA